jgi:hypothetical protein
MHWGTSRRGCLGFTVAAALAPVGGIWNNASAWLLLAALTRALCWIFSWYGQPLRAAWLKWFNDRGHPVEG